jgi:hypothetical protein
VCVQAHHNARELFITQQVDTGLEGDTLLRPCTVVASVSELAAAAGDDVFVCDHSYDTAWDVSAGLVYQLWCGTGACWWRNHAWHIAHTAVHDAVALQAAAS